MTADNGGWPDMELLTSDEGRIVRRALASLGEQQLEILGSIEGVGRRLDGVDRKLDSVETHIDEAVTQIRAEQRTEFKGVRQQLAAFGKTVEGFAEQIGIVGENASHARHTVDAVHKMLKELRVSDRFVSAPPPPGTETPSIPPSLSGDWKRTPMGGIKLDQKDQAVLAQRMAKLEEERRVADAVAADRAATIAAQKKEAEEKRLADERKAEADRSAEEARVKLEIEKSKERRAWLAGYVAAGVAGGGGIVWLVQVLTHH